MITGQQVISIGQPNQSSNSDTLFNAFTKINNNFTTLFTNAHPAFSFESGNGISAVLNGDTLTITNTGVLSLVQGSGISLDQANGTVTISVVGDSSGNIIAGVTKVGVNSNTLNVTGSPVISEGNINVNLPETGVVEATYTAPTIVVDKYGRILSATSTESVGTVTSIQVSGGAGIAVEGSPVTSSGNIVITNTGVTRLRQGTGVVLSGTSGEVTVSMAVPTIGLYSNSMAIFSSPGANTITSDINFPVYGAATGITANGTTASTALELTKHLNIVSIVSATNNGVKLPVMPPEGVGFSVKIVNTSANVLSVYPPTSHYINALPINSGFPMAGNARVEFSFAGANRWYTF
jgi:hypothetical protein